jgi:hypothetical protein
MKAMTMLLIVLFSVSSGWAAGDTDTRVGEPEVYLVRFALGGSSLKDILMKKDEEFNFERILDRINKLRMRLLPNQYLRIKAQGVSDNVRWKRYRPIEFNRLNNNLANARVATTVRWFLNNGVNAEIVNPPLIDQPKGYRGALITIEVWEKKPTPTIPTHGLVVWVTEDTIAYNVTTSDAISSSDTSSRNTTFVFVVKRNLTDKLSLPAGFYKYVATPNDKKDRGAWGSFTVKAGETTLVDIKIPPNKVTVIEEPTTFFDNLKVGVGGAVVAFNSFVYAAPVGIVEWKSEKSSAFEVSIGWSPLKASDRFGNRNIIMFKGEYSNRLSGDLRWSLGMQGVWELSEMNDGFLRRAIGPTAGLEYPLGPIHFGTKLGYFNISEFGLDKTYFRPGLTGEMKIIF